jgi:preprotein translocase subunit SecF
MTSFSTLLVVIPMLFFPNSSIFPFAVTMASGIVLGTLSSLYLAAPLVANLLQQALARSKVEILEQ